MNFAPLITLLGLVVLGITAWQRMSKTKTPIAGWKLVTLLILGAILVFFFFGSSVEETASKRAIPATSELPTIREVVAKAPWLQLVVMGGGMLLFLIGAHVIVHFQNQRLGKQWWSIFNPLQTPYKDFNRREWIQFGVLLAVSFALMVLGVNLGHGR